MNPAMARMARLVVSGVPHHVTQRGNGRARTFIGDDDYALYRDLPAGRGRGLHCRPRTPDKAAPGYSATGAEAGREGRLSDWR